MNDDEEGMNQGPIEMEDISVEHMEVNAVEE